MQTTFEAKLKVDPSQGETLAAMARALSTAERFIYQRVFVKELNANQVKRDALGEFGLTSRQYNGILFSLKGRVAAAKESRKLQIATLQGQLKSATLWIKAKEKKLKSKQVIPSPAERQRSRFAIHQKKRRLATLTDRLKNLLTSKTPQLCFGSRSLFGKQHELKANGYNCRTDWKAGWDFKRHSQFFLLGSSDETAGNQSCQYEPATKTLKVRLTNTIAGSRSKYLTLTGVEFAPGQNLIQQALLAGQAISFRFVARQKKGQIVWYVKASLDEKPAEIITHQRNGVIGVDLNAARINPGYVKADGNPLGERAISLDLAGRSSAQVTAILSDAIQQVVAEAVASKRPIVREELDFAGKKQSLREADPGYARMLSSFAYNKFFQLLTRKAARAGVQVVTVNPAYTSVIGYVKFGDGYGISVDGAAALAIARRALNLSERLQSRSTSPAVHKTLMDARLKGQQRHVWSGWAIVKKGLGTDRKVWPGRCSAKEAGRGQSVPIGAGSIPSPTLRPTEVQPFPPATNAVRVASDETIYFPNGEIFHHF